MRFKPKILPSVQNLAAELPEALDPSARSRLVVQLGVGAILLIAAAWLFGSIAEDVVTGDRLTLLDVRVAQWLHLHASAGRTQWMLVVSQFHSTVAITCYTCIACIAAFRKRRLRRISTIALCVVGGMLLNVLMKLAFHRARPHFADPILTLTSYSFPSGHVAASTIFYGLGVVWVFGRTRAFHWRVLAVTAAAFAILLVALSRMYLGVHYLSDVAAAFAEGVAWLALCLSALAAFWREAGPTPDSRVAERGSA
ncbi:MAG: phosphatase PAP2 family protein [Burkholderiaceae bacterium]